MREKMVDFVVNDKEFAPGFYLNASEKELKK